MSDGAGPDLRAEAHGPDFGAEAHGPDLGAEARDMGPGPDALGRDLRRICIVLLSGIGDVVHGLPVAAALKRDDPRRRIAWVAEPAPSEVLHGHPAVDEVVVFRKADGLRGVRALRRAMRGARFDGVLNLQRYFKSLVPTLLAGAPVRVGLARSKTRDGIAAFHTHRTPEGPWKHTQDLFLDFLDVLGVPRGPLEWELPIAPAERAEQRAALGDLRDRPVAGLVPASANPAKDWPAERYVPLAEALTHDFGYRVLLLGGPGQRERGIAARVRREARADVAWGLEDSVRRLIWRLDGCDLLISPDTGPLHIAHALRVPVIGLFGHTNPWRTGPYLRFRDLVIDRYTDGGEQPDPARYAPRHRRMERIRVEDVLERVERARRRYGVRAWRTDGSGAATTARP